MELENLTLIFKGEIGKRRCYRVYHKDLNIIVTLEDRGKKLFHVKDISTYGVAFFAQEYTDSFRINDIIYMSIVFRRNFVLKDIRAQIKRIHKEHIVCCEFLNLTRKQEYTLDKLCVTIQKELIKNLKKEKD